MHSPGTILAVSGDRSTRRQVARSLSSGGFEVRFCESADEVDSALAEAPPSLFMVDADSLEHVAVEAMLQRVLAAGRRIPVVLLSLGSDKTALLKLLQLHEIANLVAKHGAIRAAHPVLDERELLVTCMKVVQNDIFGIDKYIGGWGIELVSRAARSMADKRSVCDEFEGFLNELDAPKNIVPNLVIAAEELILNAMVHAPRDAAGKPKYEHIGPVPTLTLEPSETVAVTWGCDGQRLMLSVADNFGRLDKRTVFEYISRSFSGDKLVPENKTSGAGLGLSMAFMSIHQLVFNVWDTRRTEVIAGWYLRVSSAAEFRSVGKSLNLFWLPGDLPAPKQAAAPGAKRATPTSAQTTAAIGRLTGRVDETVELGMLSRDESIDLRELTAITSRGVARWIKALSERNAPLKLVAVPEPLVKLAAEVAGLFDQCSVVSLALPYECETCDDQQQHVVPLHKVDLSLMRRCAFCGTQLQFSGDPIAYQRLIDAQRHRP